MSSPPNPQNGIDYLKEGSILLKEKAKDDVKTKGASTETSDIMKFDRGHKHLLPAVKPRGFKKISGLQ